MKKMPVPPQTVFTLIKCISERKTARVMYTSKEKTVCVKKQYVRTGKTLYGSTIEVKEGLSIDDAIAFPYGKNVKEGAKTKVASEYADDEDDNSSGMENYDSGWTI